MLLGVLGAFPLGRLGFPVGMVLLRLVGLGSPLGAVVVGGVRASLLLVLVVVSASLLGVLLG